MMPFYYLVLMISLDQAATPPQVLGAYGSEAECTYVSVSHSSNTFCIKVAEGETLNKKISETAALLN